MAVEHDIVPFEGADVFQEGKIDSIGERVALTQNPGDFARLPVGVDPTVVSPAAISQQRHPF